jgi:hypothetical protein
MQRFAGTVSFRVNQRFGISARVEAPATEFEAEAAAFTSRPLE